jgi:hypothetical protein
MDEPLVVAQPEVIVKKSGLWEELGRITEESQECLGDFGEVELQRQGTEITGGELGDRRRSSRLAGGSDRRGSGLECSRHEMPCAGECKIQILKHMDTADIFSPFIEDEDGDEFGEGQMSDLIERNQPPEVDTPGLFGRNHTHGGIPNTLIGNDTIEFIRQRSTGGSIETFTGKPGQDLFN